LKACARPTFVIASAAKQSIAATKGKEAGLLRCARNDGVKNVQYPPLVIPAHAAIQYAATARLNTITSGILDHPLSRVTTLWGMTRFRDLATCFVRGFALVFLKPSNQRARGMAGRRCAAAKMHE